MDDPARKGRTPSKASLIASKVGPKKPKGVEGTEGSNSRVPIGVTPEEPRGEPGREEHETFLASVRSTTTSSVG